MISKRKTQIRYYHVESMGALRRLRCCKKPPGPGEMREEAKQANAERFSAQRRPCQEVGM